MKHIAILGFGVVGGGVASLLTENRTEIRALIGEEISIDYILDLRDFPDSPFGDRVVHDFDVILASKVDTVIEAMGGSHPAYEYTVAALNAGKNVITSNKEVVASYIDEFTALAQKNGVVYRYEASVGGGIPVISPLISLLRHNKIHEVRGILNGTTNYILTKMFDFGESFAHALADAQQRGYAERIPDADVLGTDACRKICILASIISGGRVRPEDVPTEGITGIRDTDIKRLASRHMRIKLVGRAVFAEGGASVYVSPHVIPLSKQLSHVAGVYNAVEVVAEPLGDVLFYGQGAGAGATASAMVSDLTLTYAEGTSYAAPKIKGELTLLPEDSREGRFYVVIKGQALPAPFENADVVARDAEEIAFFTEKTTLGAIRALLSDAEVMALYPVL